VMLVIRYARRVRCFAFAVSLIPEWSLCQSYSIVRSEASHGYRRVGHAKAVAEHGESGITYTCRKISDNILGSKQQPGLTNRESTWLQYITSMW
jgi:hypothetical protein